MTQLRTLLAFVVKSTYYFCSTLRISFKIYHQNTHFSYYKFDVIKMVCHVTLNFCLLLDKFAIDCNPEEILPSSVTTIHHSHKIKTSISL